MHNTWFDCISVIDVLFFFSTGRPTKQETVQLMVPGNVDQKASVTTGATVRKKKSMRIRALSAKQRRDDSIRALQKEHLGEIQALLQLDKPGPVEVSECVFFFMNSQPYSIARKLWCVCRYFLSIACTNVDTLFTWHYFGGRIAMTSNQTQRNCQPSPSIMYYTLVLPVTAFFFVGFLALQSFLLELAFALRPPS